MEVKKYLKRIGYKGNVKPTLTLLKTIHKNHLYNIPFENLDIHYNKKIILDKKYLSDKIFKHKRGGYCYELNGMFYLLLKELGYKTKMVSARVSNGKGGWGEEFDHLAIIVDLGNLWLADVGFGDSFTEAIKIKLNKVQKNPNGLYKIVKHDNKYLKLMRSTDGNKFVEEYIFTLKKRSWDEFDGMNNYHQTSPESHFTQKKVCSIATKNGRITLTGEKLIITKNGTREVIYLKNEDEFDEILYKHFKLKL